MGFHSITPSIHTEEYKKIAQRHADEVVDLRNFMIARPFTVFENDSIQKCLDTFRLMNLRQLPVLNEDEGSLVGIITRQDLFSFMAV